jgi:large subunit ribosomal protein L5
MRFQDRYKKNCASLCDAYGYTNPHQVPRIVKIVINMGVGEGVHDSKAISGAVNDLTLISGQKPVITIAKKSISSYKLREGMKIGCMVTLRGSRLYDFLERLVYVALPRVKDFKGLNSKSFDGMGNFNFGIKEQIVFPEIDYDKVDNIRGMDIAIVTSTGCNKAAKTLLEGFDLPFYK